METIIDPRKFKEILSKPLELEKWLKKFNENDRLKDDCYYKFDKVFGTFASRHLLGKYKDASSFIWALDSENFNKFINHF